MEASTSGIEMALRAMLVSPDFLFRVERDPATARAGSVYRIGDLELASRLSFFLWSSIPDEDLLALAERGSCKIRNARAAGQAHARRSKNPRRSSATSPASGCCFAISIGSSPTWSSIRLSMKACAARFARKRKCCSPGFSVRIGRSLKYWTRITPS